jgi:hypothetical protein
MFLSFIIPGNLEFLMREAHNAGNMGFAGILLDLYNKRNFLYVSFLICIFFDLYIGLFITMLTIFLFIKTYYRWSKFILPKNQIYHHH